MTIGPLFITGTDTDVGKTITTAALAAALARTEPGLVAIDKPVQTGVLPDEPGDADVAGVLSGASTTEGIRLRLPMAPVAAARHEDATLPGIDDHAARIRRLCETKRHVLVEGAGGLLVHLDGGRSTIADLAARFDDGAVVVVCRSGLGTLNHTELTLEALSRRRLRVAGLVIGSWPARPDDIDHDNRRYLSALGVPFLGAVPERSSQLSPLTFRARASSWFDQLP
jgi:dethiobiotin synthase